MRCWVLTMYLSKLIFLSVSSCEASPEDDDDDVEDDNNSDWDFSFSFSTSSFRATKESSAARLTSAENSTVCCPSSVPIAIALTLSIRCRFCCLGGFSEIRVSEIYGIHHLMDTKLGFLERERERERISVWDVIRIGILLL